MRKIKWGVLSTAKIGTEKVIPAMQQGELSEVMAIASRSIEKAESEASKLGIKKAYGSYEELLADPEVEAVYNPLPNSLHVEWSVKALEAGKHVLCEKPLALTEGEARKMIEVRDRTGLKAGEAFMVRSNPQWKETLQRVRSGEIGTLRLVQGAFSYYNADPSNIRNIPEVGGGGIWDIGCYPVTTSRYIFGEEPKRVVALLEEDPEMGTDRLGSVILDFPSGQALFHVSTQLALYQRMNIFGTKGYLEMRLPFTPPNDKQFYVLFNPGDPVSEYASKYSYPILDQYTLQGDDFSRAILEDTQVPVTLEDALNNTRVLTAIYISAARGEWINVE